MSTVTKFVSGTKLGEVNVPVPGRYAGESMLIENILDFSSNGPGSVLAADVVQALKVPADCLVTHVQVTVLHAEGATCTATVGDTDSAAAWDASTDLNATAGTVTYSAAGTDAYATGGKIYQADDTIDLVMGHDTDHAVILVTAVIHKIGLDISAKITALA